IGVSIYLVLGSVSPRPADSAQARAEFDSAMRKAGVTATYPGNPVTLTDVVASGSHPFSATFTGDEIAVLMSTFPYESDVGGVRANLRNVGISVPEPGSVTITAIINANGGTYSGEIGMPLAFESGRVTTSGVSSLNVEGMPTTDAQKSMAGDAFTTYFNEYLKAAPGLSLDSAVITADGVVVSGTAPDSLTYP
ncbi:MAG: hypothetical protein HGB10_07610, partial [Coriobacteriia bacterium]|nr:hypothetical protein [Coriobacteriia bacterium]